MWRSLPHEHPCMIFADCRRLCIKVGRGQGDGDIGTRVCGTWDLGTRYEKLEDIKYGTRGRVGRGNRDAEDAGCERLSQKSEVNAISLSSWNVLFMCYRKIPKTKPRGLYFSKAPVLRGLFSERLIFGGAYLRREICVSKSIGLALWMEGNLLFFKPLFYFVFEGNFQVQAPRGGLYLEGRFNGGFFALRVWGAYIWRGLFSEFYGI